VAARSPDFLTAFNLNSVFLSALPLALVALAQLFALLVGEFDLSVGALAAFVVVAASFVITSDAPAGITAGLLVILAICGAVGLLNAGLTRLLAIPSIIATIGTLSILQGIGLILRPTPAGLISGRFGDALGASLGPLPYAFAATAVVAAALDVWLHHTRGGLVTRAVGLDAVSSVRTGAPARRLRARALVIAALFAGLAGLCLAAQSGVGDPSLAGGFTLSWPGCAWPPSPASATRAWPAASPCRASRPPSWAGPAWLAAAGRSSARSSVPCSSRSS
jgi:ribose/xylose/arabinose/galactoside ABC-type transport system permease subunit